MEEQLFNFFVFMVARKEEAREMEKLKFNSKRMVTRYGR